MMLLSRKRKEGNGKQKVYRQAVKKGISEEMTWEPKLESYDLKREGRRYQTKERIGVKEPS